MNPKDFYYRDVTDSVSRRVGWVAAQPPDIARYLLWPLLDAL